MGALSQAKKDKELYVSQPSYRTKLKKTVVVNQDLCHEPRFQHVLFGRLNEQQEKTFHYLCLRYWALLWLAITGYVQGYYGTMVLYPLVALFCIRHTVNAHDCNHLKRPLPMMYRWTGYGLFCAGFLPLAPVYGDVAHQHLNVHHPSTKGVLDHDDNDPHSRLARLSLFRMVLTCAVMPGHICLEDIFFHQILKNPSSTALWQERIMTNIVHWGQLALYYHLVGPTVFFHTLIAGHVGMVILWVFFNGLLHHDDFYRFLLWVDPSGMRRIHPLVDGLFYLVSPNAWLEIKWHDVHHAMHIANGTYGRQLARGLTYTEIDTACADIVDRGLYVDPITKAPVSPLAGVGHVVGSRRAYLDAQETTTNKKTD